MTASKELIEKGYASTMEEWWDLVDHHWDNLISIGWRCGPAQAMNVARDARDAISLYRSLQTCWDQLPDHASTQDIPGFGALCDLCSDFPWGRVKEDPGQLKLVEVKS